MGSRSCSGGTSLKSEFVTSNIYLDPAIKVIMLI